MIALHPYVFLFNDTATTEIYTLSLHDALPILLRRNCGVNLLDCTTTRFVLWIDAPLDVAPQRLANSRFPDDGALRGRFRGPWIAPRTRTAFRLRAFMELPHHL